MHIHILEGSLKGMCIKSMKHLCAYTYPRRFLEYGYMFLPRWPCGGWHTVRSNVGLWNICFPLLCTALAHTYACGVHGSSFEDGRRSCMVLASFHTSFQTPNVIGLFWNTFVTAQSCEVRWWCPVSLDAVASLCANCRGVCWRCCVTRCGLQPSYQQDKDNYSNQDFYTLRTLVR